MRGKLSNSQKIEWEEEASFLKVWDFEMILGVIEHGITYKRVATLQLSSTFHNVKDNVSYQAYNDLNTSVTLLHFHFCQRQSWTWVYFPAIYNHFFYICLLFMGKYVGFSLKSCVNFSLKVSKKNRNFTEGKY